MNADTKLLQTIYRELQALSELSFPKRCATCGRSYQSLEDFISRTRSLRQSTGLKEGRDEGNNIVVELFRNCICGSTLMNEFKNRRDMSRHGIQRRNKFEELLNRLAAAGYEREIARQELLNIMQGQGSKRLKVRPMAKKGTVSIDHGYTHSRR
nr:hypothetical protein [uncultured Desulfobacter sp.]